jgi:hypothetical protein
MKVAIENKGSVTLPDFFIAGAPKGGTTSLHYYLQEHPQVFMPKTKESWFFSFMDHEPHYVSPSTLPGVVHRLEDYVEMFTAARDDQVSGDASPSYLYTHETSLKNFRQVYADPVAYNRLRFILSLRNPAERAWSQYWTLQRRHEDPLDFEQAIQGPIIRQRLADNWQPFYDYVGFGMYHDQVKAYLDEFGADRVKIILFEDLKQDALGVCRDIFRFLEVDDTFVPKTEVVYNPSGKPKSEWLVDFVLSPSTVKSLFKKVVPWQARQRIKHALGQKVMTKVTMPEQARQELINLYKPEIGRLEKLLDRDLSAWLTVRGTSDPA